MTTPQSTKVPATIHIWCFAAAVTSTIVAIPHVIVAWVLDWSPVLVNFHLIVTLGLWLAAVFFVATKQKAPDDEAPGRLHSANECADLAIDSLERRFRDN